MEQMRDYQVACRSGLRQKGDRLIFPSTCRLNQQRIRGKNHLSPFCHRLLAEKIFDLFENSFFVRIVVDG